MLQPAHSPELNPVEPVWEELREKHFYNKVFESIDAVMDTLCHGLSNLIATPKKLASMTYFPHLRIVSENPNWYETPALSAGMALRIGLSRLLCPPLSTSFWTVNKS